MLLWRSAIARFERDVLSRLRDQDEIRIRTEKHPDTAVVIWVAVAGEDVFVRSARGAKGRWYRDVASGGDATVEFGDYRLPVRTVPAADDASIERASHEYLRKYGRSPVCAVGGAGRRRAHDTAP